MRDRDEGLGVRVTQRGAAALDGLARELLGVLGLAHVEQQPRQLVRIGQGRRVVLPQPLGEALHRLAVQRLRLGEAACALGRLGLVLMRLLHEQCGHHAHGLESLGVAAAEHLARAREAFARERLGLGDGARVGGRQLHQQIGQIGHARERVRMAVAEHLAAAREGLALERLGLPKQLEVASLPPEVVQEHGEVVDRQQRVGVAVAQRAPLLGERLALERHRLIQLAQVGQQLRGRVDGGDRVGVAVAERGAAAGELAPRVRLRLLELSQLVEQQREVVARLQRVCVVLP